MEENFDLDNTYEHGEIVTNLKLGIFSLISAKKVNKKLKSKIYENDTFMFVRNEEGKVIENKIACSVCHKVFNHDSLSGTSNKMWHIKRCSRKNKIITAENLEDADIIQLKDKLLDEVVQYVAQDLRPIQSIAKNGFLNLANKFIQIGTENGNVKAEDLLPHPTTLSRRLSYVTQQKRDHLREQFETISKQGVAVSTDIWTDDYRMKSFLGVNVHFIHKGSLQERTLCVQATEDKTAVNIHRSLEEILTKNEIAMKHAVFVTDRGGECDFFTR